MYKKQFLTTKNIKLTPIIDSQSLKIYHSLPKINSSNQINIRLQKQTTRAQSFGNLSVKHNIKYINKSPSFFKKIIKVSGQEAQKIQGNASPYNSIDSKRLVDKQFIIQQAKRQYKTKINIRLLQRQYPAYDSNDYESFYPFKRSHQINRSIIKIIDNNNHEIKQTKIKI